MCVVDQCRTLWPVWPVELTWWRTEWWFCVLQTATRRGCRCSGRGSTPPFPPSVELPSTGRTLHFTTAVCLCTFISCFLFATITDPLCLTAPERHTKADFWSQVGHTVDGGLQPVWLQPGVFLGVDLQTRESNTLFCYWQQLQMWHNNEQRESCCVLNLNKTPTPWRNVQGWRIKLSTLNDLLLPLQRATGGNSPSFISHLPHLPVLSLFFFQTLFSEVGLI